MITDWNRFINECAERYKRITLIADGARTKYWRWLQHRAGHEHAHLLADASSATVGLSSNDPNVREIAINALGVFLGTERDERFAKLCDYIAFHDPDERVRASAIVQLARCLHHTSDANVGRRLLSVVVADSEPAQCRAAAYMGLYILRGMAMPPWPGADQRPVVAFSFFEHADWVFIRECSAMMSDRAEKE
jgi:hypothetical protein